jgi:hypothetical protein
MSDYLNIDGRLVAYTKVERRFLDYQPPDDLFLFHDPVADVWTRLTVHRYVRRDEDGVITKATAQASKSTYSSVAEIAKAIDDDYGSYGWDQVLDHIDFNDGIHPDLYLLWATRRMEVDFRSFPIYVKDLALATTFFANQGDLLPGVGRALEGWESHHLGLMATKLTDEGYEVLEQAPDLEPGDNPASDPALGLLTVRRYGHEAVVIVRVDDLGEVFVRLRYTDDDSPLLVALPDEDDW